MTPLSTKHLMVIPSSGRVAIVEYRLFCREKGLKTIQHANPMMVIKGSVSS